MGLTTILRGFKAPIAVLDHFLASNGVEETFGIPPSLARVPGSKIPPVDPQSAFLREKLAASGDANPTARIFIPHRRGQIRSTYAYVAYAFVMVFSQRLINLAADLPEKAPPGFTELRREILGEGEDPSSFLYVVLTDEREFPRTRTFMRESDLRCEHCTVVFDDWIDLQHHRTDAHGVEIKIPNFLPDDM